MSGLYVADNSRLLWQLLGNGSQSHKVEYNLNSTPFFSTFIQYLIQGGQHSEDSHSLLLAATIVIVTVWIFRAKAGNKFKSADEHNGSRQLLRVIVFCISWNTFFVLVAAFWDSAPGAAFRDSLSVLGSFQLNRLL